MRVHELAKELGVTSKDLVATLEQMGATGRSASSSVPEDLIPRLRASGGKATAATSKRREVLEPPPAPRKAKKPAAKPVVKAVPDIPDEARGRCRARGSPRLRSPRWRRSPRQSRSRRPSPRCP